ncbi:monosaccharide ABC transporter membrane protein, CUT2 family [Pseudomonas congelans]|jgi:ribose transport system permease protein|uniref:Monosaccharide ABC transporter membrane protein, CUT2 family n=1 Tax=Pseudomonas congelans TaxID=200452 RepID=A0A0N8R1H9_9PSED|nr:MULTISPECIES: ABC transporter permease [Pseudomonas]KFE47933.1 branched-chain amino acid ABC transporter permease [Pseudomonas congelans]KPW84038.1 ribose ABC-type transport system, permease protein [Pseudomonas congelans]MBC8800967.1 ABC transporter permease [Pseudomonas congelans]MBP1148109.1 ribose transport system permease protein [Pseudomonas sp. PvP027]PBQ13603.1 ABC transporter permease [Pseudomonas congelans]
MSTLTVNTSSTLVKVLPRLLPAVLPLLVLIILLFFAISAPGFLSWGNLSSLVLNNFVLLAIVAIGMTWAVAAGGIDLSVGTALDFASLGFVVTLNGGHGLGAAIAVALLAGGIAGAFNAMLIAGLRISPFLATLGTLFIGTSVQQLLSDGGQPIYIAQGMLPGISGVLILGVPLPLLVVGLLAGLYGLVLARGRLGREILALGTQPQLAYYSGLPTRRIAVQVFFASALACAVAGILLSSTVNAYVPMSGNAYLINAIGAVFIGTTLSRQGRPNIPGTLLGVLFINVIANGLLLIGWNFYWQQVATGALIFLVLAFSFTSRHLLRNAA